MGAQSESDSVPEHTAIARLVTRGRPPGRWQDAEQMLFKCLREQWPRGLRSKFLLLPGGFVLAEWPERWSGRFGWASRPCDIHPLVEHGQYAVDKLMTDRVVEQAALSVDVVVIGVDLIAHPTTNVYAELIALYDVNTRTVAFTGKSLPRSNQRTLVRVVDLETHFLSIGGERVLVLGCHDLNLFSPRGRAVQKPHGRLQEIRREMDERLRRFQPTVVLQLPHGTDTPGTWRAAWNALTKQAPSIRAWASGISYFRVGDASPRATLAQVLAATHGGEHCFDLIGTGANMTSSSERQPL